MKEFRTIEISNPEFENDFLRFITVKSQNLKGRGDICVFVPPGAEDKNNCPLVILLHGVYGSAWSWSLNGGVHLTALEMIKKKLIPSMVIAMPSDGLWGDGSFILLIITWILKSGSQRMFPPRYKHVCLRLMSDQKCLSAAFLWAVSGRLKSG